MPHLRAHRCLGWGIVIGLLLALMACTSVPPSPGMQGVHVPSGFHLSLFATGLNRPRFITFAPDGSLLVAVRGSGEIVALSDPLHMAGRATSAVTLVRHLTDPTSLVVYQGQLYIGEAGVVSRYTLGPGPTATNRQVIVPDLPVGGQHSTRTVWIGPDSNLYVSIGSDCNDCVEQHPHRAVVLQYHLDGSGGRVYAWGLRNAVGLATNPLTRQIWVTVNGRDELGDNIPPETIYALQDGGNYGWPTCHAGTIIDPQLGKPGACDGVVQPLVRMQAHSAPLGLVFTMGTTFPASYHGLFVAFHGSWNRSVPTGDKVIFIPLDAKGQVAGPPTDFLTGWLQGDHYDARPVGLAIGPDGALYISDDQDGNIYRVAADG